MSDPVDHPSHYSRWPMEAIEFIAVNDLPWWLANVIKYCIRHDAKDGLQDLYKGRSYLDMKIRHLEGHARFWEKPVKEQRELSFPNKALMPNKPAMFCAGNPERPWMTACCQDSAECLAFGPGCKGWSSDGELRRRQKDAGEGIY